MAQLCIPEGSTHTQDLKPQPLKLTHTLSLSLTLVVGFGPGPTQRRWLLLNHPQLPSQLLPQLLPAPLLALDAPRFSTP